MTTAFNTIGFLFLLFILLLLWLSPSIPNTQYVNLLKPWPPILDQQLPDLELLTADGKPFRLSDFRGKVIVLEYIAIDSEVSQIFAGAKTKGAFRGIDLPPNLLEKIEPFEASILKQSKSFKLDDDRIVFIHLLLYTKRLNQPSIKDAAAWRDHFGLTRKNQIVAIGAHDMRNTASLSLVPGFQLLNKDRVLRADAAGPNPKDDLYKVLIPLLPFAIEKEKR